ncbi:YceI family protein [Olivibacter sitiensis]|uniref:YceI family protein n=1 Tax=Olivibacter sitiensis TaxID=376470 RepID=UPI00040A3339|nr:YceI family protein [Olivibacter sitiensis]
MAIKWTVDPTHSDVEFKVKHLVISTVTGKFTSFDGSIVSESESDFSDAKVEFSIDADSIDTSMKDRDAHLKSADFFDAEKYPKLTFKSTSFTKKTDDEYTLVGDLTIKDVTREAVFQVELGGTAEDPYGNFKAGFEASSKISRKEFGLTWSAVTEAGSVVVGDEIRIALNLQFVKQQ